MNFSWADVTAIVTPETLIPVVLAGVGLGAFLWRMPRHVYGAQVIAVWTIGAAFLTVMGVGRLTEGSEHWEAWVGTGLLWTLFVAVGAISVFLMRFTRYRRA